MDRRERERTHIHLIKCKTDWQLGVNREGTNGESIKTDLFLQGMDRE